MALPALGELLQASQTPTGGAFAALGDLIGGGPANRAAAAYPKYLEQAASGAKALDEAALIRQKRLMRESYEQTLKDAGDPDAHKHAVIALGELGNEYAATEQGDLHAQQIQNRADAVQAALGGDTVKANAYMLGVANGPVVRTHVGAEGAYDPLGSPSQTIYPTALSNANVAEKNAQANEHIARAAEIGAHLPLLGAQTREADARTAHLDRPGGANNLSMDDWTMRQQVQLIRQNAAAQAKADPEHAEQILSAAQGKILALTNPGQNASALGALGGFVDSLLGGHPAAPAPLGSAHATTPPPNAKQAADGNWYLPDPQRPGKYLRWTP